MESIVKETTEGPVRIIRNELNLALKIRRGAQKIGELYAKDGLDAASTILGMRLSGQEFDSEVFGFYLVEEVCREYGLDQLLGYVSAFKGGANNLPKRHVGPHVAKVDELLEVVERRKKLMDPDNTHYVDVSGLKNETILSLGYTIPGPPCGPIEISRTVMKRWLEDREDYPLRPFEYEGGAWFVS